MIINRKSRIVFAGLAFMAANACGHSDKSDSAKTAAPGTDAPKVDEVAPPSDVVATDTGTGSDGDLTVKSDGDVLGLVDGDQFVAKLYFGAQMKPNEMTPAAQDEVNRLVSTLPKSGGGIQTFTAGHLTNAVKIAFRICNAWMAKASQGQDSRFATTLPWTDKGSMDKFVMYSTFVPVFEEAFWGPDKTNYPAEGDVQAAILGFADQMAADYTDPQGNVKSVTFIDDAVASCVVFAISSETWFY